MAFAGTVRRRGGLDAHIVPGVILPGAPLPDMSAGVVDDGPDLGPGAPVISADDPALAAALAREAARPSQVIVDGEGMRHDAGTWAELMAAAPPEPKPDLLEDLEFSQDLRKSHEAYTRLLKAGRFAKTFQAPYSLPGHGVTYKSCGAFMVMGCLGQLGNADDARTEAQKISEHKHQEAGADMYRGRVQVCGRMSCPTCFEASINRAAMSVADRMSAYQLLLRNKLFAEHQRRSKKQKRILQHYTVSIPKKDRASMKTKEGMSKIQNKVMQDLKALGLQGGMIVYHPWRFGDGLAYSYFAPHYHTLAAGWTEPEHVRNLSIYGRAVSDREARRLLEAGQVKEIPKEERYLYKSISTLSARQDIFGLARYLLTHAGLADKKHAVRYWGSAQNRHFRTDTVLANAANQIDTIRDVLEKYAGPELRIKDADLELWAAPGQDVHQAACIDRYHATSGFELLAGACGLTEAVRRVAPLLVAGMGTGLTQDNPAKAQSEPLVDTDSVGAYIVGRIRMPAGQQDGQQAAGAGTGPAGAGQQDGQQAAGTGQAGPHGRHKEKCPAKEVVFCWHIDTDTDGLCAICQNPLRPVLLNGVDDWSKSHGPGPPEGVSDFLRALADGAQDKIQEPADRGQARYVAPGDYMAGLPSYIVRDLEVIWSRDDGVAMRGPWYAGQPASMQDKQDAEIERTRWGRITKDVKRRAIDDRLPVYYHSDGMGRLEWDYAWLNEQVAIEQDILPPVRMPHKTAPNMRPLVDGA